MGKIRLDQKVFDLGLAESREKAKALVMAGSIYVNGDKQTKPGAGVTDKDTVEMRGEKNPFVSRGGFKLKKALDTFHIDPSGLTCIDCGASTGGFTDCLLQYGATHVYSVDVGYGQLAWSLRCDPRVTVMERVNARNLNREMFPCLIDMAVMDMSFISLRLVLPVVRTLLKEDGQIVCLVKPQFEAGREKVGKKGVVRDPMVHREVLESFVEDIVPMRLSLAGLTFSPVRGPEGNIEYLAWIKLCGESVDVDCAEIVRQSHEELEH